MSIKFLSADEQAKIDSDIRRMILEYTSQNEGVSDLVRRMSVTYDRAWNQLNRNQGVRAAFIPAYVVATGDRRPLDILAEAAGYRIVSKLDSSPLKKDFQREIIELSIDCGRTQETIELAYEDRRVTVQEYRRIHNLVNKFISLLTNLDEQIKKDAI